ncbi:MAG: XdhC family protein [Chloroflexota bacterium]
MRDILSDLERWQGGAQSIALATVVQTWGSAPRRAGSKMGLTADGQFSGSVSGGCVENAVIEAGLESLKTNLPKLLHFGVADETAWDVGLACGGSIEVFVKPLDKTFFEELRSVIKNKQHAVLITIIRGPDETVGREFLIHSDGRIPGNVSDHWQEKVLHLANETLLAGESRRAMLDDETEIFLEFISPPLTLIAVGAVHITVALMSLAKTLGYRTVVIDPRGAWGNADRFPNVDQLIQAWPDEAFEQIKITRSTAVAMLTHDPKLDDPALKISLNSPAFYVGALGSKTTHAKRRERLLSEGVSESQLARLHAPIGIDIGAGTPEEIALAVMAEVVAAYRKPEQLLADREADFHPIKN